MAHRLTLRVLVGILLGALLGALWPAGAVPLRLLSDIFLRLVKMVVAPIVLGTVVVGIAKMGDLRRVGLLGAKALLYFEAMTLAALAAGVGLALALTPGAGFDLGRLHAHLGPVPLPTAHPPAGLAATLLSMVPDSAVGALAGGQMLQVLVLAVLVGAAMARSRAASAPLLAGIERLTAHFFAVLELVMALSPAAAFGAMAFAVGEFGVGSLWLLGKLVGATLLAMLAFVVVVLGGVARLSGFSLWRLLRHVRAELLLVLGTSSSETALPSTMERLEAAGCDPGVVGLVVPTGYAFNLDGTAIYLAMALLFIAQAHDIHLDAEQLLTALGILMVTSKGAAGVSGSGLVTLAATLTALPGQPVPPEGIALVIGVDRFMSTARALTNVIGNCVATVVLARSEGGYTDRGLL